MKKSHIGILLGLAAAVSFGFIPLLTVPLQNAKPAMSSESILFFRYGFSALIIAVLMLVKGLPFRVTGRQMLTLGYLAIFSDAAGLFLLYGFPLMPTGIATTVHFLYPVFTALGMLVFFRERQGWKALAGIAIAIGGVALLSWPSDNAGDVSKLGIIYELLSALTFAIYLIRIGRSCVSSLNSWTLTFYILGIGSLWFLLIALCLGRFQMIATTTHFYNILTQALCCTALTNLAIIYATRYIGSTVTSTLGALEPVTAIIIGIIFMNELLTLNIALGIALVLIGVVTIIVFSKRN